MWQRGLFGVVLARRFGGFAVCCLLFPLMQFCSTNLSRVIIPHISDVTFMECLGQLAGICRSECSVAQLGNVLLHKGRLDFSLIA